MKPRVTKWEALRRKHLVDIYVNGHKIVTPESSLLLVLLQYTWNAYLDIT